MTDVDENQAPVITSAATASVAENSKDVIDVQSTDDSDSEGSGLTYSISGGADASLFQINSSTGKLSFINAPDYEASSDHELDVKVKVTDSGGKFDEQSITVTVTDVDENQAPVITSAATASVAENSKDVIDVQSTDDSDSEGSGLTYSISGGADASLFQIDGSTGKLSFINAPDYEASSDHELDVKVKVTDSGGKFDEQSIVVTVTDVDEGGGNQAPVITSAATASVAENSKDVIDVQSTDDSDSEGSGLTYSISGGADASLFQLMDQQVN